MTAVYSPIRFSKTAIVAFGYQKAPYCYDAFS